MNAITNGYTANNRPQTADKDRYGRVTFDDFARRLERITPVKRQGNKARCACPVHRSDNPASLSVWERGDGSVGVKCFTKGCNYSEIIDRVMGDDTPHIYTPDIKYKGRGRADDWIPYWERQIESIHPYHDEKGVLLYQKIRFSKKDYPGDAYAVRRPHTDPIKAAKGFHHWKLGDTRRVLYNLPDVLNAQYILICEGEKDADSANEALKQSGAYGDIVATTTHDGANGRWLETYTDALFLKDVIVVPDNDQPGRDHAEKIAKKLTIFDVHTVKIIDLTTFVPDFPVGGDVTDFLAAGHPIEAIIALATVNRSYHAPTPSNKPTPAQKANTPTLYVTRKSEKCDCEHCKRKGGTAVTFTAEHTTVARLTGGTIYTCKKQLHKEAVRWTNQIEDEQITEQIYMRRMSTADCKRWTARNRQNKKRGKGCHRYRPIHLMDGQTVLFSTDATNSEAMPNTMNKLYDVVHPLLQASDPNKRNTGTPDWGGDYQGSKGNGKRKKVAKKSDDDPAGKCAQYMSKNNAGQIAKVFGKKAKRGKLRIEQDAISVYEQMITAGIELRLKSRKSGAIDIWELLGITPFVTAKEQYKEIDTMSLKRDNLSTHTVFTAHSDDEIAQLIPLPLVVQSTLAYG